MPESSSITPPASSASPDRPAAPPWLAQFAGIERVLAWVARPGLAVYWPLLAFATHSPESATLQQVMHEFADVHPDKLFHFGSYAVLAMLLVFAQLAGRARRFLTNLNVGCIVAVVYAFADELTQGWFGRTPSGADITADLWAIASVYIALLLGRASELAVPRRVLAARLMLVLMVPIAGMGLFTPVFRKGGAVWRLLPDWFPYVRGDYLAHFFASMGITWIVIAAAPAGMARGRRKWNVLIAAAAMIAIAPLTEWLQSMYFGRGDEPGDLIGHELGVLVALAVWGAYAATQWAIGRSPEHVVVSEDEDGKREDRTEVLLSDRHVSATDAQSKSEIRSTGGPQSEISEADSDHRFIGHALLVGLLTLISRITGLVRDAVLAAVFGLSAVADAFSIGFLIPNLFRRLFGEGALTASFIPIYSELLKKDRLTARRLASMCVALLLVITSAITLIGEAVLAWLATRELSPDTHLAIRLTMVMLPYMPMICLAAMIGGMLQVHGRFGPPAAAPIMLNIIMIAAAWVATDGISADEPIRHAVPIIAASVLLAGFAQLLWQVIAVIRVEAFTVVFTGAAPALKRMLILMLPMVIGLAVFQINTLLDSLIAFVLSPKEGGPSQLSLFGRAVDYPIKEQGAVAALQWSQRLYQFPLGVFGIALATAIFPALAHAAADESGNGKTRVRQILRNGLRLTFFIGLPASIGLILVRVPLARLIFEHGRFGREDSLRVATVLTGYASAVWAYSMTHVVTRAFYALKDSRTPLRVSMVMVGLNLALNLALVWPFGVAGLAWSSAACAAVQVVWLLALLRRYVEQPVDATVLRSWGRTGMLSMLMAAALLPIVMTADAAEMTRGESAKQLVVLLCIGVAIVVAGAKLLRAEELRWLWRRRIG